MGSPTRSVEVEDGADTPQPNSPFDTLDIPVVESLESPVTRSYQITMQDLVSKFHMPSREAAEKLGICTTLLKKLCRKYGIARWPHRTLKSIDSQLSRRSAHDPQVQTLFNKRSKILQMNQQRMDPQNLHFHTRTYHPTSPPPPAAPRPSPSNGGDLPKPTARMGPGAVPSASLMPAAQATLPQPHAFFRHIMEQSSLTLHSLKAPAPEGSSVGSESIDSFSPFTFFQLWQTKKQQAESLGLSKPRVGAFQPVTEADLRPWQASSYSYPSFPTPVISLEHSSVASSSPRFGN